MVCVPTESQTTKVASKGDRSPLFVPIINWAFGCRCTGTSGNEEADKLARQASATPLLGPEPALGIPKCSVREVIKNWTRCNILEPG